jgi:ferredoxin-NADP reductase
MIAGGVGIAPLLGMLEEAAASEDPRSFRLLYAARSPAELAALDRLRGLQSRLDLIIHCVVDDGAEGPSYSVGPLRRDHVLLSLAGVQSEGVTALVCGPAGMMEFATDALLASGVPANSIYYERFDYAAGRGHLDRARQREALLIFLALAAAMAVFSLRSFITAPITP